MHETLMRYLPRFMIVLTVSLCVIFTLFLSPDTLIAYIGVENGYLLVLILAFISGVSVFGVAPYHLMLLTLAVGGLNPWFLALAATTGLGIGDSTSYFLGYHGRNIVPTTLEPLVERMTHFFERHHDTIPLYIFLYGMFAPFSNDFVGVTLGVLRYPFFRLMIPLLSGTFIFNATIGLLAPSMYDTLLTVISYI
ncbi:MAG: VTT domain-containing protein [Minisyncoccia bacterium]